MLSTLQDVHNALIDNEREDLKTKKAQYYLFSRFVMVLENLQKDWDSHFITLKNSYADIFKFL